MSNMLKNMGAFLTAALGGPDNYKGKDMRTAHRHLHLQEKHFTAVVECLGATLTEVGLEPDMIG